MNDSKTIKQLADALGVSKTAIRNVMDDDFRAKYTEKDSKGVIRIFPDGCKVISENYRKPDENSGNKVAETPEKEVSSEMVALLKETIETLREQLAVKDQQIAVLNKLVDQAQHLHAGTIKQALPEGEPAEGAGDPAPKKKKRTRLGRWLLGED